MKRLGITQTLTNYDFYPKWFTTNDLGEDIQLVHLSFEHFDLPLLATLDGVLLMRLLTFSTKEISLNP